VRSETIPNDLPMPFRNRNLVGVSEDPVPERLDVVELLFDGESIEARGREGKSSCHGWIL